MGARRFASLNICRSCALPFVIKLPAFGAASKQQVLRLCRILRKPNDPSARNDRFGKTQSARLKPCPSRSFARQGLDASILLI
jgi:hypothetical protein